MKKAKFLSLTAIFLTFAFVVAGQSAYAFPVHEELPVIEIPEYEIIPLPEYTEIEEPEGLAETQPATETNLSAGTRAAEQHVQVPLTAAEEVRTQAEQEMEISPETESVVVVPSVEPEEEAAEEEMSGALEPAEEEEAEVIAREPEAAEATTAPSIAKQPVSPSAGLEETPETPAPAATGKMSTSDILLILAVAVVVIFVVLASVTKKKKNT